MRLDKFLVDCGSRTEVKLLKQNKIAVMWKETAGKLQIDPDK